MLCFKSGSNSSVSRSPAFTKLLNSLFPNKFYCCCFYSFSPLLTVYSGSCIFFLAGIIKLLLFLLKATWNSLEEKYSFCHLVLLLFNSSQILFNHDLYIYFILKKSGLNSSFHQFVLCHWSLFWSRFFKFWLILSCPSNYKTALISLLIIVLYCSYSV